MYQEWTLRPADPSVQRQPRYNRVTSDERTREPRRSSSEQTRATFNRNRPPTRLYTHTHTHTHTSWQLCISCKTATPEMNLLDSSHSHRRYIRTRRRQFVCATRHPCSPRTVNIRIERATGRRMWSMHNAQSLACPNFTFTNVIIWKKV